MATLPRTKPAEERLSARFVVTLGASDREKVAQMAAKEKVSVGEIIRRSIRSYESPEERARRKEEERILEAMLRVLNESLEDANVSAAESVAKIEKLEEEARQLDAR